MHAPDSNAAARSLLNRAVATSLSDDTFLDEARRLTQVQPLALLGTCLLSASLDVGQAGFVYQLFRRVPELARHTEAGERHPRLLRELRRLLAQPLPATRQRALLLFMALLTQRVSGAGLGGEDGESSGGDGNIGRGGGGAECDDGGKPLISGTSILAAVITPLLRLEHATARAGVGGATAADGAVLGTVLQAALQVLSGRPNSLTEANLSTSADPPLLGTSALACLLVGLLELLDSRRLIMGETSKLLLRACQACVQILLPRARGGERQSRSQLGVAHRQWRALGWETQVHAWPIADRLRPSVPDTASPRGSGGVVSGGMASAGGRLLRWLRLAACPSSEAAELRCLVVAAAVPALPVRSALGVLVASTSSAGRPIELASVVAALSAGLPQGTVMEWQHAAKQVLPALVSHGVLLRVRPSPKAEGAAASAGARGSPSSHGTETTGAGSADAEWLPPRWLRDVPQTPPRAAPRSSAAQNSADAGGSSSNRASLGGADRSGGASAASKSADSTQAAMLADSAQCLLLAMHAHQLSAASASPDETASRGGTELQRLAPQQAAQQLCFATGIAKWLATASLMCSEPASAACLLGVALRASELCPAAVRDRYGVVVLQLQRHVLELIDANRARQPQP